MVTEDEESCCLVAAMLAEAAPDRYSVESVDGFEAGRVRIAAAEHDVYLIDQQLAGGTAVALLRDLRASGRTTPVIVVAGDPAPEADLEAMAAGADDYLIKGRIDAALLDRAIRYAFERPRRLAEQLRETEQLEAMNTIAGAIAHNFNNLLTVVLGNAALLGRRLPEEPAAQTLLNEIQQAARDGAALSREMLVYADRRRSTRVHHLDLSALIADMRDLLEVAVGERALLTLDLVQTGKSLLGDPAQLRHVLIEFATNAGEAMQHDREGQGSVCIRTRLVGSIEPGLPTGGGRDHADSRRLLLEVVDDGAGMDAATRRRAFDPFFTTRSLGRGLGLSAAFGVTRTHGGTIDIRSAPGSGTTVRILFPVAGSGPAATD
jgi:signal transduction histidine kinase